jgi:hypothetical protein
MRNFHLNGPRCRHLFEAIKGYQSGIAAWKLEGGNQMSCLSANHLSTSLVETRHSSR